ncbi:hypothetical protein AWZ03_000657 [Drosophila navojoa]|uniref:Uncharacterized protein n=1 Tax=Drosophila navojoa TaxID=7232 RepID=A0A484BWQ9_DRONA|nr:hypothetical protein AWZ03_000657 [Drosophila navojoa]
MPAVAVTSCCGSIGELDKLAKLSSAGWLHSKWRKGLRDLKGFIKFVNSTKSRAPTPAHVLTPLGRCCRRPSARSKFEHYMAGDKPSSQPAIQRFDEPDEDLSLSPWLMRLPVSQNMTKGDKIYERLLSALLHSAQLSPARQPAAAGHRSIPASQHLSIQAAIHRGIHQFHLILTPNMRAMLTNDTRTRTLDRWTRSGILLELELKLATRIAAKHLL